MKKFCIGVVVALLALVARPASAGPLLFAGSINGGALTFCASDNNVGCLGGVQLIDTNASVGTITLDPVNLLGLLIEGSFQQASTSAIQDLLSSSSLAITNTTGSTIQSSASIGNINYPGPATSGSATSSGTWVNADLSTMLYTFYVDSLNQQGGETALDRPGTLVCSFSDTANGSLDSFSNNCGPYPLNTAALFSMSMGFDMSLVGGGQLISRGQSEVANLSPVPVPEPASMVLLGSGLAGLVVKRRRMKATART